MTQQIKNIRIFVFSLLILSCNFLWCEKLNFKIKYLGLSIIDISFNNEVKDSLISIRAKSTGIAGALYDVDNKYDIYYKGNLLPVTYRKSISENGYREDRLIKYDRNSNLAVRENLQDNTEKSYCIADESRDFFSSLMLLRKTTSDSGMFMIDAAGKNWQVSYKNAGSEKVKSCLGKKKTCKYELSFKPVDDKKKEKSDLLTSNIVNHKRYLYFWFTDDKNRIPVKAKFTSEPFAVSWILKDYKK